VLSQRIRAEFEGAGSEMENCVDGEAPKSFLARHSDSRHPLLRKERGHPLSKLVSAKSKSKGSTRPPGRSATLQVRPVRWR